MATYLVLPVNCGSVSEITIEADEMRFEEDSGIVRFRRNWQTVGFVSIRNVACVMDVSEVDEDG